MNHFIKNIKIAAGSLILAALIFSAGCRTNQPEQSNISSQNSDALTISAAVSLKDAFNEIGEIYKSKMGKTINFNYGSSGALQKQIETGAPVDLFASAGEQQMDELGGKNLLDAETRRDFAGNTLVLIVPNDSKPALTSFNDLNKSEVKKIAAGNPKTVPAGQYAAQVFEKMNLKNALQTKLIFGEDVRQVLDYVVRGETDAGVVYGSDALSAGAKIRVAATAAEDSHAPILYPAAILKDSKQKQAARDFLDLILSAEGQAVLQKYGFTKTAQK